MIVDENAAKLSGLTLGAKITVDYGNGHPKQTLKVGAVVKEGNPFFDNSMFVSIPTVEQVVPAKDLPSDDNFLVKTVSGADHAKVCQALRDAMTPYPGSTVDDRDAFKGVIQLSADRLLSIVYAMVGLAIAVAVLGVVNTLALSVVERVHEIGLLRAVGLSRRRLRRMIRLESALIGLLGGLVGVAYGLLWGVSDQRARVAEGLTALSIPFLTILGVFVLSVLVGVAAALIPAHRTGKMNVLDAIAAD